MIELDHCLAEAIADYIREGGSGYLPLTRRFSKKLRVTRHHFRVRTLKLERKIGEEGIIDMETIIIESDQIKLPKDVLLGLKGKEVRFLKHHDGFYIKPVTDSAIDERKFPKLSKLKPRKLIEGDPEDLINMKTWEWNEPCNL